MTPRRKQPIVSTTDDEQTVATIDPEDELRDHWDNPLFGKKEDSSFESKRDTKYSARANVQKRLQLRPAIELEDSKYQGKVVDRKELDGVEDNWVSVEDSEDSQLSFEEEIENQDSVEDSVKESLDNSQFSLQLYSQTQQQASKGHAILEQKVCTKLTFS